MPETSPDPSLHLPSLVIKNFRGIDELTIPRLGRVTLLAGKNGVGKTTVLDAVRVWADRGVHSVFDDVLRERGDCFTKVEAGTTVVAPDRIALFTDRGNVTDATISIGPVSDPRNELEIKRIPSTGDDPYAPQPPRTDDRNHIALQSLFGEYAPIPRSVQTLLSPTPQPSALILHCMGPDRPADSFVGQLWNDIALTAHEDRALEAINLITHTKVERVALLDPPGGSRQNQPRRMMAMVKGKNYQVPLRTLGDGAMRTYAVALALAKSSDGLLLIDEVENGIHHSVQAKFWEMVLKTAQHNNVQVLATTHSSDCAYRFGQVASELPDIEGILYRIQRNGERLRAVPYPEDQLTIAAEHGIEVR